MPHEAKIHLLRSSYAVREINMIERLQHFAGLEVFDRNRLINHETYRLEDYAEQRGYILCNFIRLRMDEGPGKGSTVRKVTGFGLKKDEGFAEETAVAYNPEKDHWAIQYNHHGPRASSIAEYLNVLEMPSCGFDFVPVWRQDVMDELRRRNLRTKVTLKIAATSLTAADAKGEHSLAQAIALAKHNAAEFVTLELSARRGRCLSDRVDNIIQWFSRVRGTSKAIGIERFLVTAKSEEGGTSKEINLLEPRVEHVVTLKAGSDRRLPVQDRWNSLCIALEQWSSEHF